jgi:hypothetical protein
MGFNCFLEDEHGNALDRFFDPKSILPKIIPYSKEGYWLVKYIDPYGDTVFNQLQIPILIDELKAIKSATTAKEHLDFLQQLIDFIDKSQGKVHSYIKFYGD